MEVRRMEVWRMKVRRMEVRSVDMRSVAVFFCLKSHGKGIIVFTIL